MHAIDTNGAVSSKFDPGDPGVPRLPTQVDHHWCNAVQEELLSILAAASVTPVKGDWDQVLTALYSLFVDTANAQSVGGAKTFLNALTVADTIVATPTSGNKVGIVANGRGTEVAGYFVALGSSAPASVYAEGPAGDLTKPAYLAAGTFDMHLQSAITKTASPGANVMSREMIPKAWARITTDGASGYTIDDAINVASCSFPGSNTLRVTFAQAMASANYAALAHSNSRYVTVGENASYVDLVPYNETNDAVVDPAGTALTIRVAIFGRQ